MILQPPYDVHRLAEYMIVRGPFVPLWEHIMPKLF